MFRVYARDESGQPLDCFTFATEAAARRAARALRAGLPRRQPATVEVRDPASRLVQRWLELPDGGRFERPGGF